MTDPLILQGKLYRRSLLRLRDLCSICCCHRVAAAGKTPITGYNIYKFEGVTLALNTQADPEPVKLEVQTITTDAGTQSAEVQSVQLTGAVSGSFKMYITAPSTTCVCTLALCQLQCVSSQ